MLPVDVVGCPWGPSALRASRSGQDKTSIATNGVVQLLRHVWDKVQTIISALWGCKGPAEHVGSDVLASSGCLLAQGS